MSGSNLAVSTATVVENRLEPVTRVPVIRPIVVTGMDLFNHFVVADESDKTRMGYIRSLVDKADALQIGGACDNMVERAIAIDYPEGKPKKAPRLGKEQHARNVKTVIQQAWGALCFAREALNANGYDDSTGWNAIRVMAPTALRAANVNWQGIQLPSDTDKERSALLRQQKAQTSAMLEATKETPRMLNESYESWQTRVALAGRAKVEEAMEQAVVDSAAKEFKRLVERCDNQTIAVLTQMLTDHLRTERNGSSEVSEAEADALLKQAVDDGVIEEVAEDKPPRRKARPAARRGGKPKDGKTGE